MSESLTAEQKRYYIMAAEGNTFDEVALSPVEKTEHNKLFKHIWETPEETIIKDCILVLVGKDLAVGLKKIQKSPYLAFKTKNVKETKALCRKHHITTENNEDFIYDLAVNAYLYKILPEETWERTASLLVRIGHKNKIFAKLKGLFEKPDDESVIADHTRAIELNPEYAWAFNNRGIAYSNKGDHDNAIADCARAVKLEPSNQVFQDKLQAVRNTKTAAEEKPRGKREA